MSGRGASAAVLAEMAAARCKPVHLVEIHFDDETIFLTDAYRPISWSGNNYLSLGHYMGADEIEETAELQISSMRARLSNIDRTMVADFLTKDYIDRPLLAYEAFLDNDEAVVSEPFLVFSGRMDEPALEEDPDSGKSVMSVTATNHWTDFSRKPGRHTCHEEQQIHYPGDKGFEFSSQVVEEIYWGRK